MAGGIATAVLCVLALFGAGELLIRGVEGLIGVSVAEPHPRQPWLGDPYATAHGDVPSILAGGPIPANRGPLPADELAALRKAGL